MALPKFHELFLPILTAAKEQTGETRISEIEDLIANSLKLSEADRSKTLPSGRQTVFLNRLHWAKVYLEKAKLIDCPRRAFFTVSERGHKLLSQHPKQINLDTLAEFPEFVAWKSKSREPENAASESGAVEFSPEESIAVSFEKITQELSDELLVRVHTFTPSFFERLIVDLLLAMGYGGGRSEMGRALGRTGDGGIDGVIKEDELGLDVVYMQAKRYGAERPVAVSEVRDFVGSLEGHRATKGVFVTTSYFPKSAHEFISRVSKRVILIDGSELAKLMIRHRVGVRTKDVYEIKKIDEDYFAE